jgi:hypothetical protein
MVELIDVYKKMKERMGTPNGLKIEFDIYSYLMGKIQRKSMRNPNFPSFHTDLPGVISQINMFYCFIIFRTILYCDECHDFMDPERAKGIGNNPDNKMVFSEYKWRSCEIDIRWFGYMVLMPNLRGGMVTTDGNIIEFLNNYENTVYEEVVDLLIKDDTNGHPAPYRLLSYFRNGNLIKYLRAVNWMKNNPETTVRGAIPTLDELIQKIPHHRGGGQPVSIKSEADSKIITDTIIQYELLMKLWAFSEIQGLCDYDMNAFKILNIVKDYLWRDLIPRQKINNILKTRNISNIALTVDATQSSGNLMPIYFNLFNIHKYEECNRSSDTDTRLVETWASNYDPANSDKLYTTIRRINKSKILHYPRSPPKDEKPVSNENYDIMFSGIPIIKFKFIGENEKVSLFIYQYFSLNLGESFSLDNSRRGTKVNNSVGSITSLLFNPRDNDSLDPDRLKWTIFKTMGDFLQIASFSGMGNAIEDKGTFFLNCFVTVDIICGKMASILEPLVICELSSSEELFQGAGLYMSYEQHRLLDAAHTILSLQQSILGTGTKRQRQSFGKKKTPSLQSLQKKAKSVGINVTEKKKYKTVNKLIQDLKMYKSLQEKAKKRGIHLRYKKRSGETALKTYSMLEKQLKKKTK